MSLRQVEQGFSSFFAKFDDFSKWGMPKWLQNFEKSSNMPKKMAKNEEILSSICQKPIFLLNLGTRKSYSSLVLNQFNETLWFIYKYSYVFTSVKKALYVVPNFDFQIYF